MLVQLAIRDIVLIDRLDIVFGEGLTVLTGETGAGKSILLDAFALALGGRGDGALVRHGFDRGQVTAAFELPHAHPALAVAAGHDIPHEGELILRRVQFADGRTRAFVNDQPVGVQALRAVGAALVEIHGQHDDRALVDPAAHRALLDAFGGCAPEATAAAWRQLRAARESLAEHRARIAKARSLTAEQVQQMVTRLLQLPGTPSADAADALACAICHAHGGMGLAALMTVSRRRRAGRVL